MNFVFYSLQPNVGSLFSPINTMSRVKSGSSAACNAVKFPSRNLMPSNVSSSSSSLFFSGSLRFASLTTSSPKKSRVPSSVRASAEVRGFAGFFFSIFFPRLFYVSSLLCRFYRFNRLRVLFAWDLDIVFLLDFSELLCFFLTFLNSVD